MWFEMILATLQLLSTGDDQGWLSPALSTSVREHRHLKSLDCEKGMIKAHTRQGPPSLFSNLAFPAFGPFLRVRWHLWSLAPRAER